MTRLAVALLFLIASAAGAAAQETRIAAVVNDDVISLGDLEARTQLILLSSQLPDNAQVRQRVIPQVLRSLIDEKLQIQEAKKFNIVASDSEVTESFDRLEQQNNMPKGSLDKLLASRGIPRSTLVTQISAGLVWNKLVEGKYGASAAVSDEEINETMARIKQDVGRPQNHVAEIFLTVDKPDQEADVKALADRLAEQIRQGANFGAVAQQFSQSPTAAVGGDLGWLSPTELPRDIAAAVEGMQPGQLSAPIRGTAGFYLLYLADRRIFGAPTAEDTLVTLSRVGFPFPPNGTDADKQRVVAMAQQVSETVKSCGELTKVGQERAPQSSGEVRDIKLGTLPRELQERIAPLQIAEASKPILAQGGVAVVMVCERKAPPSQIPTKEQLGNNMARARLETLARRYLRDLRRSAFVDMRV